MTLRVPFTVLAVLAIFTMVGCGSKPAPAKVAVENGEPELVRKIATGAVELNQKDDNLNRLWHVKSQGSELVYEEGRAKGKLTGLMGETFTTDKESKVTTVVSTFSAREGDADQSIKTLVLRKDVTVTSKGKNLAEDKKMTAQGVRWLDDFELVEASGDVTMTTPAYKFGPLPKLIATKDLKAVGTPDHFKGRIQALITSLKSKSPASTVAIAALVSLTTQTVSAQTAKAATYQAGDLTITGYNSVKAEYVSDTRIKFVISGPQIIATSRTKGFRATAKRIEGFLQDSGKKQTLESANITGGVTALLEGDGPRTEFKCSAILLEEKTDMMATFSGPIHGTRAGKTADDATDITAATGSAILVGFDVQGKDRLKKLILGGGVTVTRGGSTKLSGNTVTFTPDAYTDSAGDLVSLDGGVRASRTAESSRKVSNVTVRESSTTVLTGASGVVVLVSGNFPLRSFQMNSGAKMLLTRNVSDPRLDKPYQETYSGTGNKLSYSDAELTLRLTGNVVLTSKARLMEGESTGDELIITLNEKRELKGVEVNGGPGETNIKEVKPKP